MKLQEWPAEKEGFGDNKLLNLDKMAGLEISD